MLRAAVVDGELICEQRIQFDQLKFAALPSAGKDVRHPWRRGKLLNMGVVSSGNRLNIRCARIEHWSTKFCLRSIPFRCQNHWVGISRNANGLKVLNRFSAIHKANK